VRRLIFALVAGLWLAPGCGPAIETRETTPEDEKAAEQRLKDEAARELKARQLQKNKPKNPADAD
jgi:hypothetical protein